MKKTLRLDLYPPKPAANPAAVYRALKDSKRAIVTYNQLMKHYEQGARDIAAVFISPADDILFQHLPLFCRHFGIGLYALPADAPEILSSIFGMKYVNIVGMYKDDEAYASLSSLGI